MSKKSPKSAFFGHVSGHCVQTSLKTSFDELVEVCLTILQDKIEENSVITRVHSRARYFCDDNLSLFYC